MTDLTNLYLIDFSNTYNEELSAVWVDAKDQGNETRFINDCSGIAEGENAQFKVNQMIRHLQIECIENMGWW